MQAILLPCASSKQTLKKPRGCLNRLLVWGMQLEHLAAIARRHSKGPQETPKDESQPCKGPPVCPSPPPKQKKSRNGTSGSPPGYISRLRPPRSVSLQTAPWHRGAYIRARTNPPRSRPIRAQERRRGAVLRGRLLPQQLCAAASALLAGRRGVPSHCRAVRQRDSPSLDEPQAFHRNPRNGEGRESESFASSNFNALLSSFLLNTKRIMMVRAVS